MLKRAHLIILLLCCFLFRDAMATGVPINELITILKTPNPDDKERALVNYIKVNFEPKPAREFKAAQFEVEKQLVKYDADNRLIIHYFFEGIYQQRSLNIKAAVEALEKAIELSDKANDHFLLFTFFARLALVQGGAGNSIEAVASYRMAKKEAVILNDPYLQVTVDVNISDIYYKNGFYSQSLFHLGQAERTFSKAGLTEQRIKNVIYNNKAENFFRMNNFDSLKKYNQILHAVKDGTYRIYIYRNRTDYYLYLLQHNYKEAVKRMALLQKDTAYKFDNLDRQNLANAYYNAGVTDSAKRIVNDLLVRPELKNHPEIQIYLYELLGKIAEAQHDENTAEINFKKALLQAQYQINRLTHMGNISSQIKMDEMQNSYIQREERYKRERLWLIFTVVIIVLASGIIIMVYRNKRQKHFYENLLLIAKKEELSHINSHEVRRHLSNILGLINVIKNSDNKEKEYRQAEEHLLNAAQSLDEAIKSISDKLNE